MDHIIYSRVRAKFRCLAITQQWDGKTLVRLGPVKRDGKDSENSFFWKYTPSGEAELGYNKGQPHPFTPGAYYYVDMSRDDKGVWSISGINQTDHTVEVSFYRGSDDHASWSSHDQILAAGPARGEPQWTDEVACLAHWEVLSGLVAKAQAGGVPARLASVANLIRDAKTLYARIQARGVVFEPKTGPGHLDDWEASLKAFRATVGV